MIDSTAYFYETDSGQFYDERIDWGWKNDTGTRLQSIIIREPGTAFPMSWETRIWNKQREDFVPRRKATYIHDMQGRIISEVQQIWNATFGDYTNSYLRTRRFNADGLVTEAREQRWDMTDAVWREVVHHTFKRNKQNCITAEETIWQTQVGSTNRPARIEALYDASGLQLESWREPSWNEGARLWQPNRRTNCISHIGGRPGVCIEETYLPTMQKWDTLRRITYTYNAAGDETSKTDERYNARRHTFTPVSRKVTVYNAFNQVIATGDFMPKNGGWDEDNTGFHHYNYYEPIPRRKP